MIYFFLDGRSSLDVARQFARTPFFPDEFQDTVRDAILEHRRRVEEEFRLLELEWSASRTAWSNMRNWMLYHGGKRQERCIRTGRGWKRRSFMPSIPEGQEWHPPGKMYRCYPRRPVKKVVLLGAYL